MTPEEKAEQRAAERAADRAKGLARGAAVAEQFKSLRVEREFWCVGGCRRRIAAVVIHRGERCLFIAGGRDERIQRTIDDAKYARDVSLESASAASDTFRHHHETRARWFQHQADQLERDGALVFSPWAVPIGPVLAEDGPWEDEGQAACVKCHRGYAVTVTPRREVVVALRTES